METEEGVNGRENPENEIKVEVVEKTGEVEENGGEMEVSESGDENITAARIKVEVKTNEEEASEKVTPNKEVDTSEEVTSNKEITTSEEVKTDNVVNTNK